MLVEYAMRSRLHLHQNIFTVKEHEKRMREDEKRGIRTGRTSQGQGARDEREMSGETDVEMEG